MKSFVSYVMARLQSQRFLANDCSSKQAGGHFHPPAAVSKERGSMEITVLGFSNGLDCLDSANASLLVRTSKTSILVDVSGSPRQSLLKAGMDSLSLDAVLLTHGHIDHIYAFPSLIHSMWLQGRTKPLIVAGNDLAIEVCRHFFSYFRLDGKVKFRIDWRDASSKEVGDVQISSFSLYHRPEVPVNGYTFIADGIRVSYFPDSVASLDVPQCAMNSDIFIHEAGGLDENREEINKSHTTALQAAMMAKKAKANELLLVHVPENPDLRKRMLDEARDVFPNASIPSSFQKLSKS